MLHIICGMESTVKQGKNKELKDFIRANLAQQIGEKDHQGRTPLHCAVMSGKTELVRLLLDMDLSAANIQDVFSRTPLFYVYLNGENYEKFDEDTLNLLENATTQRGTDIDGKKIEDYKKECEKNVLRKKSSRYLVIPSKRKSDKHKSDTRKPSKKKNRGPRRSDKKK